MRDAVVSLPSLDAAPMESPMRRDPDSSVAHRDAPRVSREGYCSDYGSSPIIDWLQVSSVAAPTARRPPVARPRKDAPASTPGTIGSTVEYGNYRSIVRYGCCPDGETTSLGPKLEGCDDCRYAKYGGLL